MGDRRYLFAAIFLSLFAATACYGQPPERPATAPPQGLSAIRTPPGHPFTVDEKRAIVAAILAHPQVAPVMAGHNVQALRVFSEDLEKAAPPGTAPARRIATAVLFDYTSGRAHQVRIDTTTGALVAFEPLSGRPPASPDEIARATRVIQADAGLTGLLQAGGVLEGGFIVDPPAGVSAPPGAAPHRFIEFQILSRDRTPLQRRVYVDLTANTIAASQTP